MDKVFKRMEEINAESAKLNEEVGKKGAETLKQLQEKGTIKYEAPYSIGVDTQIVEKESLAALSVTILSGEHKGAQFISSPKGTFKEKVEEIQDQLDDCNVPIKIVYTEK